VTYRSTHTPVTRCRIACPTAKIIPHSDAGHGFLFQHNEKFAREVLDAGGGIGALEAKSGRRRLLRGRVLVSQSLTYAAEDFLRERLVVDRACERECSQHGAGRDERLPP